MKKKINIGLDIGVASVGYSIIDEDNNILQLGVRLFDDVVDSDGKLNNVERREKRTLRRRIRRIATRKDTFKKMLKQFGYCNDDDDVKKILNIDITKFGVENPVELKIKALKEKIPQDQLLFILFHYLHHRGRFNILDDDEIKNKKDKKSSNDIKINFNDFLEEDKMLNNENQKFFPSNRIYEFYKNCLWNTFFGKYV